MPIYGKSMVTFDLFWPSSLSLTSLEQLTKVWHAKERLLLQLQPSLAPPVLQTAEATLLRNIIEHKSHLILSCQFVTWDFYRAVYTLLSSSAFLLVYVYV